MTDAIELRIEGTGPIVRKAKAVGGRQGNNALRRALTKGVRPIQKQARANALRIDDPATAEKIAKNIAIRSGGVRRERLARGVMKRVGVLGGAKPLRKGTETGLPGGNTTHWRFVEFGTSEARAQPFMRPAMMQASQATVNAFTAAAPVELDKELAKLG